MDLPLLRVHLALRNTAVVAAMAQVAMLATQSSSAWHWIVATAITAIFAPTAFLPLFSKQRPETPGVIATLNCVLAGAGLIYLAFVWLGLGFGAPIPVNILLAIAAFLYPLHGWRAKKHRSTAA